jgi:23S rRNA (adenine2503-C2)-methyltransferase
MNEADIAFVEGQSEVPPIARMPSEWSDALARRGERSFRAVQIFDWIQAKGVTSPERMSNLPVATRQWLAEAGLAPVASVAHAHRAADSTVKLVVALRDGNVVETVLIPMVTSSGDAPQDADLPDLEGEDPDDEDPALAMAGRVRVTQCISTQVGCAMRCAFCSSGVHGLRRHLGPDEIVSQTLLGKSVLAQGQVLTNIVVMGMGEPLHNYDATARALRLLTHPQGIGLGRRRITVSTVGIVPGIDRLGRDFEGRIGLAVSLHASDDPTRNRIVPMNKRYPLHDIVEAIRRYPLPPRRRVTVEYALIDGVNDGLEAARRLAALLEGVRVKVNLIPMNPVPTSPFQPPPMDRILAFQEVLSRAGYICLIRRRRGDEISAACGQLASIVRHRPGDAA